MRIITIITGALPVTMTCILLHCSNDITFIPNIKGKNRVQPISFGHYNIYLIKTETGYILVDGGMALIEKLLTPAGIKIERKMGR